MFPHFVIISNYKWLIYLTFLPTNHFLTSWGEGGGGLKYLLLLQSISFFFLSLRSAIFLLQYQHTFDNYFRGSGFGSCSQHKKSRWVKKHLGTLNNIPSPSLEIFKVYRQEYLQQHHQQCCKTIQPVFKEVNIYYLL